MPAEPELSGRIAVVTGGGRGIGRAIAIGFAEAGADVAVVGRSRDVLDSAVAEIEARGRRGLVLEADLRDVAAIPEKMYMNGDENIWTGKAERAIELFGALKGLNKKWMGFGSLGPVLSPAGSRLLNAARDSGLITLWVGWDAMTDQSLAAYGASRKIAGPLGVS